MRAFSLAETILASFILALVVLALFHLIPSAGLASARAEQQMVATALASSELESLRIRDFDALPVGGGEPRELKSGRFLYRVDHEIYAVDDLLRRIRVTVSWEHGGKRRSHSQETWLSDLSKG